MAKQITDAMVLAFKREWEAADADGDEGNRVRRGLSAALNLRAPEIDASAYKHEWEARSHFAIGDDVTPKWGRDRHKVFGQVTRIFRLGKGPWRVLINNPQGDVIERKAADLYKA